MNSHQKAYGNFLLNYYYYYFSFAPVTLQKTEMGLFPVRTVHQGVLTTNNLLFLLGKK